MLELAAAEFTVPHAGLTFVLDDMLLPPSSCLLPRGDNGSGKTTFLEHVLIPRIRRDHQVLYLAQDLDIQFNTIRATLALLDHPVPDDPIAMATAWVRTGEYHGVLILDEFDKYLTPTAWTELALARFNWVVSVTHVHLDEHYRTLRHGFALHFERATTATVRLRLERLW